MKSNRNAAQAILNLLETSFSDIDHQSLLKTELAFALLGPLPIYSNRQNYQITGVTTVTASVFALCHYTFTDTSQTVLLFQRRTKPQDIHQLACFGGFINLDSGESPCDALVREMREESADNNGNAVLNVAPERFKILHAAIDYRGTPTLQGTHNTGYALALQKTEFANLQQHSLRLNEDPLYRQSVRNYTNSEVDDLIFITAETAGKLDKSAFAHPNEYAALQIVLKDLGPF